MRDRATAKARMTTAAPSLAAKGIQPADLSITHKSLTQIEIMTTEMLNRMNPL
jgi:hypothetical protein